MRNRIRVLALSVVAIGGGVLASPPPASATYIPPPLHCCCEMSRYGCLNKCCSRIGCYIDAGGCRIITI